MPMRRANWYAANGTRAYPLDDRATNTGDNGERLPGDILTDLHLRFPIALGQYAFVGGMTVSPSLVSMVFLAATSPTATSGFSPLAAISLPRQSVQADVHVPLRPLQSGVGGFVVLGDVTEPFVGRFSTPQQSLLSPRAARPYRPLPIPTAKKLGRADGMTGVVSLLAGSDLEIVKDRREIVGVGEVDAIVIRLKQVAGQANVLERYIGPCGARPESENCKHDGIEAINEVRPDCDGNIRICFQGLEAYPYRDCGGEVLVHAVDLPEVCGNKQPGRFQGRDLCETSSDSSASATMGPFMLLAAAETPEAPQPCAELPYRHNFDAKTSPFFVPLVGDWGFAAYEAAGDDAAIEPQRWTYRCAAVSSRNVSIWDACAFEQSFGKRVTVDLQLSARGEQNGGIVFDYRRTGPMQAYAAYLYASLDKPAHALRLWACSEQMPPALVAEARLGDPVQLGDWYRLTLDTGGAGREVRITVSGVTRPDWRAATLATSTARYDAGDGLFGLGSIRGCANFSFFHVEER